MQVKQKGTSFFFLWCLFHYHEFLWINVPILDQTHKILHSIDKGGVNSGGIVY